MPTIAEAKKQFPQIAELDDNDAVDVLHSTFYADLPREQVASALGVKPAAAPKQQGSQFVSGFKRSFQEIPALAAGAVAYGADVVGAEGVRDKMLKFAKESGDATAAQHEGDAASITDAWDGKTSWGDFLANASGYVVGQALQSIATGGVGALGAKTLLRAGAKEAAEAAAAKAIAGGATEAAAIQAAKDAAIAASSRAAKGGAAAGAFGHNLGMEAGSIYPDAVDEATRQGRQLDGGDKLRVGMASLLAAGVDTGAEAITASRILGGSKHNTQGIMGRLAREVPAGMAREAGTEAVQTGIEHYGAGVPIADEKGLRDIIDSAGVGAVGGGMGGAGASVRARKVPETGPLSRAANAGIEQEAQMVDAGMPVPLDPGQQAAAQEQQAAQAEAEKQAQKEQQAAEDEAAKRAPIFSATLNDIRTQLGDPATMQAVRQRFGDEGTTQLLNSLNQAQNPKVPEGVRQKHMQAVEEAMAVLKMQREPAAPQALGMDEQQQIGMSPAPLGIELDTSPTGAMRVDSDGNVAPETRADAISTRDALAEQDSLGQGTPRGVDYEVPPPAPVMAPKPAEAPAANPPAQEVAAPIEAPAPAPTPEVSEKRNLETSPAERQGPFDSPEAAESYISQQRRSAGGSLPPALPRRFDEGSYGVVTSGHPEFAAADGEAKQRSLKAAGVLPGDVLNKLGAPFTIKRAATTAQKKHGGTVVEVKGGFVVRPEPEAKKAITGEAIDKDWTAFTAESGTKGVPRADMPQIKAEHRGAMVNFLNARGITHETDTEIQADQLKPTQAEFAPAKVEKAKKFEGGDRSILISADNHVLDGHHQWLAKFDKGEPVKAIRLNAPIDQLLATVKEFPSATQAEGATQPNTPPPSAGSSSTAPNVATEAKAAPGKRETSSGTLAEQWQAAVDRGDTEGARALNERIVAEKSAKKEAAQQAAASSAAAVAEAPAEAPAVDREAQRAKLELVAERLGAAVFKGPGGWHATGDMVTIPDADVDVVATGAVSANHVFAHELAHVVMKKRGYSFKGFPKAEVLKRIPNYDALIAASKEFRPGVHTHENERFRKHAMKPDEVLADAIASVLIDEKPIALIEPLMAATGMTKIDLGLEVASSSAQAKAAATAPEPAAAAPAAAPKPAPAVASARQSVKPTIEDFGETLAGARKDYAAQLKEASELDMAAEPMSKSWPEPDYQKLIDGGAAPAVVGWIRAARDQVPTKPQTSWKLDGWLKTSKHLRHLASSVLAGSLSPSAATAMIPKASYQDDQGAVSGRAELYAEVGHAQSLKGVRMDKNHYSLYRGEKNVTKWVIEQKAKATAFSNWPRELAVGNTREEALAQFKEKLGTLDLGKKAKGQPQFIIYRKRGQEGSFIGKKIGREYIDLKKLDTTAEARAFLADKTAELEAALAKYRETPFERNAENQPRVGDDHRNGAAVSAEAFAEAFGFRGVQFGNYVDQARRQSDLNQAYDGLMDLAAVIGVTPRALSLNGKLGLAFGARGRGGANAPAAHFEPDRVVINLTKGSGPGSLAHEWWHGLDNYFSRVSVEGSTSFVTAGAVVDRMRGAMQEAFKAVKTATQAPTLRRRARELDKRRTKPYWDTTEELSARAFESYVIAKLQDQNAANDYLANVVDEKVWNIHDEARAKMFGEEKVETYPYPGQAELPAVRAAFDHFFQTVETKTDEAGNVGMFSRTQTVATLKGDEIAGQVPTVQLRRMAVAYAERELIGKSFTNKDSGTEILVTRSGIKHGVSGANSIEIRVLAALPQLLENSRLMETVPDKLGRPDVKSVQQYQGRVEIAGESLEVGVVVREMADGHRYYDHFALKEASPGGTSEAASAKQTLGDQPAPGDGGIVDEGGFSRGSAGPGHVAGVRSLVEAITDRWANAPPVVVVPTFNDASVPADMRKLNEQQLQQGADGSPAAFYHQGKTYIVADQMGGDADVVRALFHETLGHFGLRGTFGRELGTILDRLATLNAGKVRTKAKQYGLDFDKLSERRLAAEEVLAEMAEKSPELGWVKRAVAAIRSWLRDHVRGFGKMKFSDAEIIHNFLLPARKFVTTGEGASPQFADTVPGEQAGQFSRMSDTLKQASTAKGMSQLASDLFTTQKTFGWWHRSIGTQYHKASVSPEFKKVYDRTQDYLHDTTSFATDAAAAAPDLLPQLNSWRDLMPKFAGGHGRPLAMKEADKVAVAKAVFQGTLTDMKVYSPDELRSKYGLNNEQAELYKQFRATVDRSLDILGASDIARLLADELSPDLKTMVSEGDTGRFKGLVLAKLQADKSPMLAVVQDKFDRIDQLKSEGYAPLMRFGRYTVDVVDGQGERVYFGMYESQREANVAAREMAEPGTTVTQGIMSQEAFKQFKGVSPETLELFAELAGVEKTELLQAYLKNAVANRSALKRMIERKGIAGFSEDPSRVLAAFVTSNARAASGNMHLGDISRAVAEIPKQKGDVLDEAQKLKDYVQNPQEEAQAIRGLLFTQYLGGSIASAMVNMTQPLTMSYPFLAQYGGAVKAAGRLMAGVKGAVAGVSDPVLKKALLKAEQEGIVSPQEIHQLQAEAGRSMGNNPWVRKGLFLWGSLFSLAEQFNRRATFIAAYNTAVAEGIADAFDFAADAVGQTQGIYNKANKPNWARGAVGGTLFTFKQFSIGYMEFLKRLPPKERALALGVLMLAAGAQGLPGADDLDDVIDTIAQHLGYDFSSKKQKARFMASILGEGGADFMLHGFSALPGFPLDVSGRMSVGNLIPGSGMLLKSKTDKSSDVLELAGPVGSLAKAAVDLTGKGQATALLPTALRNIWKGLEMYQTGQYKDGAGRKVMDVDAADVLIKGVGFQPAEVARSSRSMGMKIQQKQLAQNTESEITAAWAQGLADGDPQQVTAARERLTDWNEKNPESRIAITRPQILRRVRDIKSTRDERFSKTVPKEMRGTVGP